jgi:hypothetical protein
MNNWIEDERGQLINLNTVQAVRFQTDRVEKERFRVVLALNFNENGVITVLCKQKFDSVDSAYKWITGVLLGLGDNICI